MNLLCRLMLSYIILKKLTTKFGILWIQRSQQFQLVVINYALVQIFSQCWISIHICNSGNQLRNSSHQLLQQFTRINYFWAFHKSPSAVELIALMYTCIHPNPNTILKRLEKPMTWDDNHMLIYDNVVCWNISSLVK